MKGRRQTIISYYSIQSCNVRKQRITVLDSRLSTLLLSMTSGAHGNIPESRPTWPPTRTFISGVCNVIASHSDQTSEYMRTSWIIMQSASTRSWLQGDRRGRTKAQYLSFQHHGEALVRERRNGLLFGWALLFFMENLNNPVCDQVCQDCRLSCSEHFLPSYVP